MKTWVSLTLALALGLSLVSAASTGPQTAALPFRPGQSATLLPDGRWLLAGGEGSTGPVSTLSVWDPRTRATNVFSKQLFIARAFHSATLLPDGTVLIMGGVDAGGRVLDTVERVDLGARTVDIASQTGPTPRAHHSATLMTDGRVLVTGGIDVVGNTVNTADLFDPLHPSSSTIYPVLGRARRAHTAALLSDGSVLVTGGLGPDGSAVEESEVFDPSSERFTTVEALPSLDPPGAPSLAASVPSDGAVDVPATIVIALRFSRPLRVETVSTQTVFLVGPGGSEAVTVVPAEGGRLAFISPVSRLLPGARYAVTINGALDVAGAVLPLSGLSFTSADARTGEPAVSTAASSASGVAKPSSSLRDSETSDASLPTRLSLATNRSQAPSDSQTDTSVPSTQGDMIVMAGGHKGLGDEEDAPDSEPPCDDDRCRDGDPVDLASGLFVLEKNDLVLPDRIPIRLTRTYRQNDARSRPFGIGTTHPYELYLVGDQIEYQFADLILPSGRRIRYTRTSPGTGFDDAVMEHTTTRTAFHRSVLAWSKPRGWTVTLKDGTQYRFQVFLDNGGVAVLTAIRDRRGNELVITRGAIHQHPVDLRWVANVTRLLSPNGRWIDFTYDMSDRITRVTDVLGRSVAYTYDASGRLATVTDPAGGLTSYTYEASDPVRPLQFTQMRTLTDARGIKFLENTYDADGRVIKQTQADGSVFLFSYSLDQTVATDPRGIKRRVTFNADKQIVADTRAVGKPEEQTITYDLEPGTNLLLSVSDALGRKTAYTYDAMGNLTSATRLAGTADAVTTTFTYEPAFNKIASATDPLGQTTTFAYDAEGNLIRTTDPLGNTATRTYDEFGQLTAITDPLGNTTQFTYELGDLVAITDPLGNTTTRFLDAAGRLLLRTTPLGHTTRYTYDALNRLMQVTDARAGVTAFTYDANGNRLTLSDARGNVTRFTYDVMDRLAVRTDPLLKAESAGYDLAGNLILATDRKGQLTTVTYDALDRRTNVKYADGSTIAYEFDAGHRLTKITDSVAKTIRRTYDALDRVTQEVTPQGTISYTYDKAGRRTSMTVLGQPTATYTYDAAHRLTQIAQGASVVSFTYDTAGRRTSLTLSNGVLAEYAYDRASRVTAITYRKGATLLGDLTYEYDVDGNRVRVGGSFARLGLPAPVPAASYNAVNQQHGFGDKTMTFDANGNLATLTDASGVRTYTWNARNQLAAVNGPSVTASFLYDGVGRREKKTVNGNLTEFLFDGVNPVQETAGTTVVANMLTGLGADEYFARSEPAGIRFLLSDAARSTVALSDSGGTTRTEYTYEAFGTTTVTGELAANPFQFTGRENDGTGLNYYRARYYDPGLGRFISEDPIGFSGGDPNLYVYALNSPIQFVDPTGLRSRSCDDVDFDFILDDEEELGGRKRSSSRSASNKPPSNMLVMNLDIGYSGTIPGTNVGVNLGVKISDTFGLYPYGGLGVGVGSGFSVTINPGSPAVGTDLTGTLRVGTGTVGGMVNFTLGPEPTDTTLTGGIGLGIGTGASGTITSTTKLFEPRDWFRASAVCR